MKTVYYALLVQYVTCIVTCNQSVYSIKHRTKKQKKFIPLLQLTKLKWNEVRPPFNKCIKRNPKKITVTEISALNPLVPVNLYSTIYIILTSCGNKSMKEKRRRIQRRGRISLGFARNFDCSHNPYNASQTFTLSLSLFRYSNQRRRRKFSNKSTITCTLRSHILHCPRCCCCCCHSICGTKISFSLLARRLYIYIYVNIRRWWVTILWLYEFPTRAAQTHSGVSISRGFANAAMMRSFRSGKKMDRYVRL